MDSRPARVARGFVAAATSTIVAALSHAAGGGAFPHPMLLLAGFMFIGLFCVGIAGRRASVARLIPAVGVSQLLFHLLFQTAVSTSSPLSSSLPGAGGHAHHLAASLELQSGAPVPMAGGAMIVAHVFAALVTVLALRFGEAAFWGLFETARLTLTALFRFAVLAISPVGFRPAPAEAEGFAPVLEPHFLVSHRHRGPPSVAEYR